MESGTVIISTIVIANFALILISLVCIGQEVRNMRYQVNRVKDILDRIRRDKEDADANYRKAQQIVDDLWEKTQREGAANVSEDNTDINFASRFLHKR